ncbi:MAG: hypothetical protein ABIR32_12265 [Ilumatobacteraceae bacterium]
MTISAEVVRNYVDQLRAARGEIDRFSGVEREVGLAALRQEAVATLRQASTTAVGTTDQLDALRNYTSDLVGGEIVDKSLQVLDSKATKAANSALAAAATWAWTGTAPAWILSAVGFVVGILGFAFDSGAAFGTALAAGAVPGIVIARGLQLSPKAFEELGSLWTNASNVGRPSERVLAKDVATGGAEIWRLSGGRGYAPQQLTAKARSRTQAIVGSALTVLGVVAVIFVAGAYSALSS